MDHPEFFEFGKILKTHGHQGWLKASYFGRHATLYKKLESVFLLIQEQPVPFFVDTLSWKGSYFLFKLKEIDSVELAAPLVGATILLPDSKLPALEEGDFFLHDLLGIEVRDKHHGSLGTVVSYFDQTAQPLVEIENSGKKILVPLVAHYLKKMALKEGFMEIELPAGYLEILTQE